MPQLWGVRACGFAALLTLCVAVLPGQSGFPTTVTATATPTAWLQLAANRILLEQPGTSPFHLSATLEATSDMGDRTRGTLVQDWYNDRWSRQTVKLDGPRVDRLDLDGHIFVDSTGPAFSFDTRRLLSALLDPLHDIDRKHLPDKVSEVEMAGLRLQCILLEKQPSGLPGVRPQDRSLCFAPVGDLRIVNEPFGFRTVYNNIRTVGNRHVAMDVELFHYNVQVAKLHVDELRVAPELTPQSFAVDAEEQRRLDALPIRMLTMLTAEQTAFQPRSIDAHMMPALPSQVRAGQRFAMVRILIGEDGRLQDAEVLSRSDQEAQSRAVHVLRSMVFRRRTA